MRLHGPQSSLRRLILVLAMVWLILSLAMVGLVLAMWFEVTIGSRGPSQLVESALGEPVLGPLVVIDSWEGSGLTPNHWVHFTASPTEIEAILERHRYHVLPNPSYDYRALHPPTWWSPASLGTGLVAYQWDRDMGCDDVTESRLIWVNEKRNEVFAVMYSNW